MYSQMSLAKIAKSESTAGSLYLRSARNSTGLSNDCIWANTDLYGRVGGGGNDGKGVGMN